MLEDDNTESDVWVQSARALSISGQPVGPRVFKQRCTLRCRGLETFRSVQCRWGRGAAPECGCGSFWGRRRGGEEGGVAGAGFP
jgi:hypothetical protein